MFFLVGAEPDQGKNKGDQDNADQYGGLDDLIFKCPVMNKMLYKIKSQYINEQYPESTTEGTCIFIPLNEKDIIGETVPQVKPGPVDLPVHIEMFIHKPECDDSKMAGPATGISPGDMGQPEDKGHLRGINNHRKEHTRYGCIPEPPCSADIPYKESNKCIQECLMRPVF